MRLGAGSNISAQRSRPASHANSQDRSVCPVLAKGCSPSSVTIGPSSALQSRQLHRLRTPSHIAGEGAFASAGRWRACFEPRRLFPHVSGHAARSRLGTTRSQVQTHRPQPLGTPVKGARAIGTLAVLRQAERARATPVGSPRACRKRPSDDVARPSHASRDREGARHLSRSAPRDLSVHIGATATASHW